MRNCVLVLIAAVMLCVPLGCNRGGDEQPEVYERDVDGPPVAISSPIPDYEIIGDPAAVARRRRALEEGVIDEGGDDPSGGGNELTGPESEASQEEIGQIKDVVTRIMATDDLGDKFAALESFDGEGKKVMQDLMQASDSLQTAANALDTAMETKFGLQYPAEVRARIKTMHSETNIPSTAGGVIEGGSPEQFIFKKIGDQVVVTTPGKRTLVFSNIDAEWKVGFDNKGKEALGLFTEKLGALSQVVAGVSAGVEDGSVTADNVEARINELTGQLVAPVDQKIKAAMGEATGGADAGAGDGTDPAGDGTDPADGGADPAGGGADPADGGVAPAPATTPELPEL